VRIAFINYVWDADLATPEAALARYFSLTDWSEAVKLAGASGVVVFQRFREAAVIDRKGIPYHFFADRGKPMASKWTSGADALHAAVVAAGADLVHVNGVFHPRRVRRLRTMLPEDTALLVQDHGGFEPQTASPMTRAWLRRGLAAADALMLSSIGQVEQWRAAGIVPKHVAMFDVMESSTWMRQSKEESQSSDRDEAGSPALLWVGRLNANKDPLTVLRGVVPFFETHPAARLTMIYAENQLEADVRAVIARTPALASRVRLVGRVPRNRMAGFFNRADLFVLGSHREGSGYAAIEALACGVLPVVTSIPPFRALTNDAVVGELWEPGNAASLGDALNRAAARINPQERAACAEWFERSFSWPVIGRRAMAAYRDVLEARRHVSRASRSRAF
jgi:glycosyltransferase involved in cell wall biosynthesis